MWLQLTKVSAFTLLCWTVIYCSATNNERETCRRSDKQFHRQIRRETVADSVDLFEENGIVDHKKRTSRPAVKSFFLMIPQDEQGGVHPSLAYWEDRLSICYSTFICTHIILA